MRYLVIFIVVTLLFAIFACWVVFGSDMVRDWQKTQTHITEFERTLEAIDNGIMDIEQELGRTPAPNHRVALHSVRARYLETRTNLLYHINNISPPRDYTGTESE